MIALVIIAAGFLYGVCGLFALRLERGDVYPPYSSLRSDPLGARALFLALGRVPGITVRRNFLQPARMEKIKGATYFFLGADASMMGNLPEKYVKDLETVVKGGNRLVVAFVPAVRKGSGGNIPSEPGEEKKTPGQRGGAVDLAARWGVSAEFVTSGKNAERETLKGAPSSGGSLSVPIPNPRSNIFFRADGRYWRTICSVDGKPVLIERGLGAGSIVFLSGSYPLSNEALRSERSPAALSWLLGSHRTAVFDEFHLGVSESPGIMSLVRRYRLEPFLAGLLVLAILYAWKNSLPSGAASNAASGSGMRMTTDLDAGSGMVNLLRRNIPRESLLEVCLREWTKSFSRHYPESAEVTSRLRSVLDQQKGNARSGRETAQGYGKIAEILAERKRK